MEFLRGTGVECFDRVRCAPKFLRFAIPENWWNRGSAVYKFDGARTVEQRQLVFQLCWVFAFPLFRSCVLRYLCGFSPKILSLLPDSNWALKRCSAMIASLRPFVTIARAFVGMSLCACVYPVGAMHAATLSLSLIHISSRA